jgi:hypothetical protein
VTGSPLFLDTTIHVDRVLKEQPPELLTSLEALLSRFNYLVGCSYSRLEFKRVVIQNLALTLDYLCDDRSFFRALQRATAIGARRPRRAATLISIAAWLGFQINQQIEVTLGEELDRKMALRAESYLRNAIVSLWKRFDKNVDSITDKTECRRSLEGPRLKGNGRFDASIPESKCKTKECNNANFFRAHLPLMRKVRDQLEQLRAQKSKKLTRELEVALDSLKAAISNPAGLYDYKACAGIGDIWMHLECLTAGVKDFATTNYKESEVLCPMLGLTMQNPAK